MVDVWEMEVQRARTWLRAKQHAAAEHRRGVFLRVNTHMAFIDHQRALRCSQEEENEDLAALDFLSDVNAEDMSALLRAEATAGTSGPPATVSATVAAASTVTAVDLALKPVEMPPHLIASPPKTTLRSNGAGTTETTTTASVTVSTSSSSTHTVAPTSIGMSLSSDENVKELMEDLQLDVHVHSDMEEERKTEESTPPHAANGYQAASISAVKDKARRAGFAASTQPNGARNEEASGQKPNQAVDASSNRDAVKKKPANPVDPDAVASEMLSWVSGVRDPTVLQRKESLAKRNRKRTRYFGTGSAEEQYYVQQKVKYYTQDSDSDEVSSVEDNDYSPSEDPVDFEPEEPVDKDELLSEDYLNSDDESLSNKRKRLKRQKKSPPAKRKTKPFARSSKPVNSDSASDTGLSSTAETHRPDLGNGQRSGKVNPQFTTRAENGRVDGVAPTTIDLRSSDDDANPAEDTRPSADGRKNGSAVAVNGKNPILLRLKVPESFRSQKAESIKDKSTATPTSQEVSASSGDAARESEEGYETPELPSDGDESDKENSSANASASNGGSAAPVSHPAGELANEDGEVSDTGTVDFDFDRDETTEDQPSSSSTERSESRTSKSDNGGDASDAETVVLDEEPASDDLGLDYSDDSDHAADPDDVHEKEQPSSVPGVQQFFDYKPLKLKPKKAVDTRKTIPVHPEADFITAKKSSEGAKSDGGASAEAATSVGSNDLRPKQLRSIETSITMKGKHPVVRRSIKVLEKDQTPSQATNSAATRQATARSTQKNNEPSSVKQRYAKADRPTGSNGLRKSMKSTHRPEAAGSQDVADGESSARYLSYSGSSASGTGGTTKSATTKPTPIVAPSRYGGGGDVSAGIGGATLHSATNGTKDRQFRRDPQISLYDALHIDGKEEDHAFMDRDAGYKRPSAFKKLQAESARSGVALVTSKAKEPDWDRIPIPKKGIAFTSGAPESRPKPTESASRSSKKSEKATSSKKASRYGGGDSQSSKDKSTKDRSMSDRGGKKQRGRQSEDTKRASHYGPSSDDTKSRNDRRRSRTPSPPRHNYKRYEDKESRGGRGDKKRRGSSRSPSPRSRERDRDRASRDKKSSKQRPRSPSPGRKRSRSDDRDAYQSEKGSRKRSASPPRNDKKRSNSSSSGSFRDADARDYGASKKQKTAESSRVDTADSRRRRSDSPQSGALASFDDGNDLYISESDPEIDMEMEKREDIRYDLESVAVDPALVARRVYVTGFNPAICGEELEEIFAPFDVETDRETGFPAIDVFTCQRTFKSRGDACVTFLTEEGAAAAVEELNAKHVKSSLIGVRLMDVHTQRILNAQFEVVRDTWKCSGTRCRADVSTWDNACPKCQRKRCFGPSHHKITRDSWLCSICFTANDKYDNDCKGCGESLPDTGRFSSYRS